MSTLTVIAGPNGSGKSTLTRYVDFEGRDRLLDPDAIARDLNQLNPSAAAIPAGRCVVERTTGYFNLGVSFAVETNWRQIQVECARNFLYLGGGFELLEGLFFATSGR